MWYTLYTLYSVWHNEREYDVPQDSKTGIREKGSKEPPQQEEDQVGRKLYSQDWQSGTTSDRK